MHDFEDVAGIEESVHVFGSSVDEMQREQNKYELEYECGTVTSSTQDVIHFICVKDVKQVVQQMVNELRNSNQLILSGQSA